MPTKFTIPEFSLGTRQQFPLDNFSHWKNLNIPASVCEKNFWMYTKGKRMKKTLFFLLSGLLSFCGAVFANNIPLDVPVNCKTSVVGGGIIGALESYYAYKDAQKEGTKICITVYEKGNSFGSSKNGLSSTNTSYNIVPSLTIDEILSVVPRGSELVEKLATHFSQPGGIRVDDVSGANDSESAINFKESVAIYGSDKNHDDRTLSLLILGKKSMDLWQQMYDEGDAELKAILEASNFNPCREPRSISKNVLHDGYRIDLIYGIPNAQERAFNMQADYEKLGYKNCAILSPDEAIAIDPYLADFCHEHSDVYRNDLKNRRVAEEAPRFLSKLAGAEAAKLSKFSDAGGTKSGGCPTSAETDSSGYFGINADMNRIWKNDSIALRDRKSNGTLDRLYRKKRYALDR